jgi:hypothetical protein
VLLNCDVVPAPNGDGQVTNADISYMINTLNGTEVDPPGTAHSGDCIVNGVVTSSDYNVCLQFPQLMRPSYVFFCLP